MVTIIGKEDDVENAKEAILNMAEDYIRDYLDTVPASPQQPTVGAFLPNARGGGGGGGGGGGSGGSGSSENGFVLKDAPWEKKKGKTSAPNTQSQEDFPEFAAGGGVQAATPITSAWGPKN